MNKRKQSVSETLRNAIKESGLTHYRIAKDAGTTPAVVSRFAYGERDLRLETVDRIAEVLGLELRKREKAN